MTYDAVLGYVRGSRQQYAGFVLDGIRDGFARPWDDLLAQMVLGDRDFVEKLKRLKIKGNPKDQPSYRLIQSIDAETLIKQAANYFRLGEADLTRKRGAGIGKNGRYKFFLMDENPLLCPSARSERSPDGHGALPRISASGRPALKYKSHRPKVFLQHDHHMAHAILLPSVLSGRVCLTNIA